MSMLSQASDSERHSEWVHTKFSLVASSKHSRNKLKAAGGWDVTDVGLRKNVFSRVPASYDRPSPLTRLAA